MAKSDKRQLIMQAAERLFTNRRFHEVTTDDVAREAGVGKGTLYQYFHDKDDLFFETANSGFDEMCDLLRRKVPETAPFGEQLLGACMEISSFFGRRRKLLRMMQSEEARLSVFNGPLHQRWMDKRKTLISALAAIVARGVEQGQVRPDVPTEVLASFLLGMLRTRAADLHDADEQFRKYEWVVELFRHGAAGNGQSHLDTVAGDASAGPTAPEAPGHG
ncbi:MAG: TetR/AcrR family transcriptional regulator [Phycisphaerae bacterium]|jgi:AcrR family transcriptional regulator